MEQSSLVQALAAVLIEHHDEAFRLMPQVPGVKMMVLLLLKMLLLVLLACV